MEYLALYRKYRPKDLEEVVGQSEIKKILASSVKNGTITHAYLFSGPRGTGKTTMAKILAKMVNCLNPVDGNACNKCESCLNVLNSNDVIEIDAASNNGVDEIRDLREKANLVPNSAKYKVYIIDEVHMLTTQAFNALLKTLEEPPKHVIFILATTEYYKIPLTITSRCQKFQFNKININEIVDRLKLIAKEENISISDDALVEIAKISDGGMRDSINFLDQLRSFSNKEITIDEVYEVCGNVSSLEMLDLFQLIRSNNCEKLSLFFEKMDISGKNYGKFLENVTYYLKDIILFDRDVNHNLIKSDIDIIGKIASLFTLNEAFFILESVNEIVNRLKNMSNQTLFVLTNILLIANKLSAFKTKVNTNNANLIDVVDSHNSATDHYDLAFQFTSGEQNVDDNLTSNDDSKLNMEKDIIDKSILNNKDIIINNAFAVANKNIKVTLQNKCSLFKDYLVDKKYKVASSALVDTRIEVAGDGYIIFSADNSGVVEKVYNNYNLCKELIFTVFDGIYNFVVLSNVEWEKYRDEYVANFKKGKKYELKELTSSELMDSNSKVNKKSSAVDKLFELVGEENIEFK